MKKHGQITTWNEKKGFGFITPNDGSKEIFIHITGFQNKNNPPSLNQAVSYSISQNKDGKLCAIDASRLSDILEITPKSTLSLKALSIALVFFSILFTLVLSNQIPYQILLFYFIICIFTFLMYKKDKSAALNENWRIPENTLHLLSLMGGWSGALIAQQNLRHKSTKQPFKTIFYITMSINLVILMYFLTPKGHETLIAILLS